MPHRRKGWWPWALIAVRAAAHAADPGATGGDRDALLQLDSLGRLVATPTNTVPAGLLPPATMGIGAQVPTPTRGTPTAPAIHLRLEDTGTGSGAFEWFPSQFPPLMPYLAGTDRFGNTTLRPGPLIESVPLELAVQRAKYELSRVGLNYSLAQTLTVVNLGNTVKGDSTLGAYTLDFAAKWTVFSAAEGTSAGWVSTQVEALEGFGPASRSQSPRSNLGTFTNPSGVWSAHHGFRIPELAWQQSFHRGEVVVLAGVVSQSLYLDANSYANSGRGQFLNSALINSAVLPLPAYNPGLNLQWQPSREWYAMAGLTAGNAAAGNAPWTDFTWDTWSSVGEVGYTPKDVLGLGHGVYRIQPFIARAGGPTQGGLAFNLQQQLGHQVPIGWFGRFGAGGSAVSSATAQVGTGFVVQAPLKHLGIIDTMPNDAFGVGIVWSRPAPPPGSLTARAETVLEAGYVMTLTPLARLQPDIQVVWNPSYHADADHAVVLQLQLDLSW